MNAPTPDQRVRLSAPANLLVAGEYAVTHPGGQGLAVAVEPRGFVQITPGDRFEIVSRTTGVAKRLLPLEGTGEAGPDPGALALARAVIEELGFVPARNPAVVEIDTGAFFDQSSGRKLGLGSSAVAALLLTGALVHLQGEDPVSDRDRVIAAAIRAHRCAHGGRGSGYDIATSGCGGAIRFVGGETPRWEASTLDGRIRRQNLSVYGWTGAGAVDTANAVGRFDHYIPAESDERSELIERSNTILDTLERAESWKALFAAVSWARAIGEEIGERIGVPARIDLCTPHRDDGWVVKASGAGNERAVILAEPSPRRAVPRQSYPVHVSTEGLRWDIVDAATPEER